MIDEDKKIKKENDDLKNRIRKMKTIFEEIMKEDPENDVLAFLYRCFNSVFEQPNTTEINRLSSYDISEQIKKHKNLCYVFLPEILTKFFFTSNDDAYTLYNALENVNTPMMLCHYKCSDDMNDAGD